MFLVYFGLPDCVIRQCIALSEKSRSKYEVQLSNVKEKENQSLQGSTLTYLCISPAGLAPFTLTSQQAIYLPSKNKLKCITAFCQGLIVPDFAQYSLF